MGETRKGYSGSVTLVSPAGETRTIEVPGRELRNGKLWVRWRYGWEERFDRRFRKLLSAGWRVCVAAGSGKVGEEEKRNTDVVIGTTKTGNDSHGGDHASCEVKDSPNHAKASPGSPGETGSRNSKERGCRGGQKKRSKHQKKLDQQRRRQDLRAAGAVQSGGAAVFSPAPIKSNAKLLASAEASAELLKELIGRSQLKVRRGITIDAHRLLVALEIGDDPLPALEFAAERPKLRILVTPDCSGSTQDWSGLGQAWAIHLAGSPDVDVRYVLNGNGEFYNVSEPVREMIGSVDLVIYLGDGDGIELCRQYASMGATVIALDSYAASVEKPRLKTTLIREGMLCWVDRVSAKAPETWVKAISLCLK